MCDILKLNVVQKFLLIISKMSKKFWKKKKRKDFSLCLNLIGVSVFQSDCYSFSFQYKWIAHSMYVFFYFSLYSSLVIFLSMLHLCNFVDFFLLTATNSRDPRPKIANNGNDSRREFHVKAIFIHRYNQHFCLCKTIDAFKLRHS